MGPSKDMSNQGKHAQQARAESPSTESEPASPTSYGDTNDYSDAPTHRYEDPNLSWEWSSSKLTFEPRVATKQNERPTSVQPQRFDQDQPYDGPEPLPQSPTPSQFQYIALPPPQTTTNVFRPAWLPADLLRTLQEYGQLIDSRVDEMYGGADLPNPGRSIAGGFARSRAFPDIGAGPNELREERLSGLPIGRLFHSVPPTRDLRSIYRDASESPNMATDPSRQSAHIPADTINRIHSRELRNVFVDVLGSVARMRTELKAIIRTMLEINAAIDFLDGREAR